MGSRRADARLLLPELPRAVLVLGDLPGWSSTATPGRAPDLVVCAVRDLPRALAVGAPSVVVEGGGGARALRGAGLRTSRWLAAPDAQDPEVLVPLEDGVPARYALRTLTAPAAGVRALRNAAFAGAAGRLPLPGLPAEVAVGTRLAGPPALVRAALAAVPPAQRRDVVSWLPVPGQGDGLSRGAFLLFERGRAAPSLVVKVARAAGRREPFDRDQAAWELVQAAGPAARARVPALLARFDLHGHPASVETAAPGERLGRRLVRGSRAQHRRVLAAVVDWVTEVGVQTLTPPPAAAGWRAALRGSPAADALPPLPGVLAHHDLGTWNVLVDGTSFSVVDWESAQAHGPPLWDLLYLLSDGLALSDGARTHQERADHVVACAAGETSTSAVLHDAVRAYGRRLALPPRALGPLAALCWQHHAGSRARRGGGTAELPAAERVADRWMAHPRLGTSWAALDAS